MPIISNFPSAGEEKINNAKIVTAVAADQIQIGDTVYTVENDPYLKEGLHPANFPGTIEYIKILPDAHVAIIAGSRYAKVYAISNDTITYVSDIYADSQKGQFDDSIRDISLSPDGKMLIVVGQFTDHVKIYHVNGTTVTYAGNITEFLNGSAYFSAFSPDGNTLVIGGVGGVNVYTVSNMEISYVSKVDTYIYNTISFSPDGKLLVLGGASVINARTAIYSVEGTAFTFINEIYRTGTTKLTDVKTIAFAPDGKTMVIAGGFYGYAKIYRVEEATVTCVSDIYSDNNGTPISASSGTCYVRTAQFSPDGGTLVIGGSFKDYVKVYFVNGMRLTYSKNIGGCSHPCSLAFFPDGKTLLIATSGYLVNVFSVDGVTITRTNTIYDAETTIMSSYPITAQFSPDGKTLILGGRFSSKACVYSVNGQILTYIDNIYADAEKSPLQYDVSGASFSPDGKLLALCSHSNTGCGAKIYSVNHTNITFMSDVPEFDGSMTRCVNSVAFSPDGTLVVFAGTTGGIYGSANIKLYSIDDTTISHIRDIYADSTETAFNSYPNIITFSPNSQLLVIGGNFNGCAKVYAISGTDLSYIDDIYADNNSSVLNGEVKTATFSPDGNTLVLGGSFTGRAKVYHVNETQITYISDIYGNRSGTSALKSGCYMSTFSPEGDFLIIGEYNDGVKIYSVNGTNITYLNDICDVAKSYIYAAAFSPNGKTFILCGSFNGHSKSFCCDLPNVFSVDYLSYPAPTGEIAATQNIGVGFSKSDIDTGNIGMVKLIANICTP